MTRAVGDVPLPPTGIGRYEEGVAGGLVSATEAVGRSPGGPRRRIVPISSILSNFVRARRGVEAFLEPRTTVTETTVLLIAHDGEWTRRRIDGPEGARRFAHRLGIPIYDVALIGYPKRMRDYNERRKQGPSA